MSRRHPLWIQAQIDERKQWEQLVATCRICGKPSTRVVGETGFCREHVNEARAAGRSWYRDSKVGKWDARLARFEHAVAAADAKELDYQSLLHTARAKRRRRK